MINEKSLAWGRSKSCIRELAGYASARKAEIGVENVFDFSIGNPSVPSPPQQTIKSQSSLLSFKISDGL